MPFFNALIDLSNAMAPYILFGLLITALLHETIPQNFIQKHLGKADATSVIKATLFGIPIPVCSCSVIPLAISMQKSGASKGAVVSFLISTPITGIDSILATYGVFGFAFMIYRIFTCTIVAITAGLLVNSVVPLQKKTLFSPTKPIVKISSCCQKDCSCANTPTKRVFSIKNAISYAFGTLLGDIANPLFWGLLIGAAITAATPANLSELLIEHPALAYLLTIAIAIPMYVCATASLPIAAALVMQGVSLGAAFVFLTAGPATNTVTIGVVKKMLGKRAVLIYLFTIAAGSLLFGVLLDLFFLDVDVKNMLHINEEADWIATVSSIFLWALVLYHLIKERLQPKSCCSA